MSVGRRLRALVALACLWAVAGQAAATAGPLSPASRRANFDRNCEFLTDAPLPLPDLEHYDAGLCDVPVPRQLHQIWFGPPHPVFAERMRSWERFAAAYDYTYKLWQAEDLKTLAPLMSVANAQALAFYLREESYQGASDLVRITILDLVGGIYLDSDLQPPSDDMGFFDLDRWLPLRGVTAISENEARQTGEIGTFLTNCLLAAPGGHPLIAHLVDTVADHHDSWTSRAPPNACYATGPWHLTRSLSTAVNVVPMDEGYAWRLFGHTRQPDAHAWPAGRQNVPTPQAAPQAAAPTSAAGPFSWLSSGLFAGSSKRLSTPTGAEMALDVAPEDGHQGDVDCDAVFRQSVTRWVERGSLHPSLLDGGAEERILARCGGRRARRFSAAQLAAWATPKQPFRFPAGDAGPDHPVPPGRRHAGGPDHAQPQRSAAGQAIPPVLHMVRQTDGTGAGRQRAWQAYADRHGFTLRLWSPDAPPSPSGGAADDLLEATAQGFAAGLGKGADAALSRGLGLAALAIHGGVLLGPELTPPQIDLRRLLPWRNAAIIASPHSPTYRGLPADLHRLERGASEVLYASGRGRALGSNATVVYPGFLAAAPGHLWIAAVAGQAASDLVAMASDAQLPAGLVLGEAALSRSLGGAVTLLPMRMAVHAGLVPAYGSPGG